MTTLDEKIHWDIHRTGAWPHEDEAFTVKIAHYEDFNENRAAKELALRLEKNAIRWITFKQGNWWIDLDAMRRWAPRATDFPWLHGVIQFSPQFSRDKDDRGNIFTFEITEEFMQGQTPKKIFLSHKGANKPMVRSYHRILRTLGYEPWLDEDAMAAGAKLERALLQGMSESCAAVFFITQEYSDDGYLASEVDYAVKEKRKKDGRFAIITLVFPGGHGRVPELLQPFVWKTPETEFEALHEIVRALPITLPPPIWK